MQQPFASMFPIRTDTPEEAARFWREKKEREDQAAAEADEREPQAKVIRSQTRKGPRTSGGAETK